jgi:hypothetical protein
MALPKTVELTKDGGNFYRAQAFHYLVLAVVIVPVLIMTPLVLLNPFWFRDSGIAWFDRQLNQLIRWRNLVKYRIYLGTDPELWHALKDHS